MDITPLIPSGRQIIQSYSPGSFRISGVIYNHPVIVYPDIIEDWHTINPPPILKDNDFIQILKQSDMIDIVLWGSGTKMQRLPFSIKTLFHHKNMAIESMDSGAACRTYNVLLAEGRRVAALLLPV